MELAGLLSGNKVLEETTLEKDSGWGVSDKILVVDISGVITTMRPGMFSNANVCNPDYIKAVLNKARKDSNIKAVILRIDSPGGGVAATDTISYEIEKYTKETRIPVYAMIQGLGCSGGYHVACSAQRIYIQPSGLTGSIGVIMSYAKISKLAEKIGLEQVVVKSGDMKDIGNAMRDMTEEERGVVQKIINDYYGQFLDQVIENRSAFSNRKQMMTIADGRVYTASQALANNLVDQVAHLDGVIADIKKKAGVNKSRIITYAYYPNSDSNIYSQSAPTGKPLIGLNIPLPPALTMPLSKSGFFYLWQPGL